MPDPLFHSEPELSPAEFARVTGVSPDMQRDWRRRGYIDDIGTMQKNGRWKYDWSDAFLIFIARKIVANGFELTLSLRIANTIAPFVLFQAQHQWGIYSTDGRNKRFFRVFKDPAKEVEGYDDWTAKTTMYLDDGSGVAASILVDAHMIAYQLPEDFKPAMVKAAEITFAEISGGKSD